MDLSNLTQQEKDRLLFELNEERNRQETQRAADMEAYKALKDETIDAVFANLEAVSKNLLAARDKVFDDFEKVTGLKNDLLKVKKERRSDTFTSSDGSKRIILGCRTNEGWADEVQDGIQRVMDFLKTLARDSNSAMLVETIMGLLARNKKGNLKASRVLELEKLAVKSKDPDFLDGIRIIKESYRPEETCLFVSAGKKDKKGKWQWVPLSISAI
jgi:hypothetical protein